MAQRSVLFVLLLFMLFICGCITDTEGNENEKAILGILEDFRENFNYLREDTLMKDFSVTEYLHNGKNYTNERTFWLQRFDLYNNLEFEDIHIQVDGNYATASFILKLTGPDHSDQFIEPTDIGDISYFHYNGEKWEIYGNQQNR